MILAKRLHPGAEVLELDRDLKALARAGRKAGRRVLPVRLDRGFAEELPYPDASFDRVLSTLMFHHLGPDQKEGALREVRCVLRPGGSLHLLDLTGARARSRGFVIRLFHRKFHRNEPPSDDLEDRICTLMRGAGFADLTEVAHQVTRALGLVTYYRATAPPAGAGAARRGANPGTEAGR